MIDLTFFSACFLGIMIMCSHPQHLSRKSMPTRSTSHSYDPHGWGFFILSLSPTCMSMVVFLFPRGQTPGGRLTPLLRLILLILHPTSWNGAVS